MNDGNGLSWRMIREAVTRINGRVNHTPVLTSDTLDRFAGASLFFKCENFQKTGAFKARGATNAIFALSAEAAGRGVVTHSSGNHAAAVARAARLRAVPSHIIMPDNSVSAKVDSVKRYGGTVIFCAPNQTAREETADRIIGETGAVLVHAYDDLHVMAGQATTGTELLEEVEDLDIILCPLGGGGHLSGISVAAKTLKPSIRVFGVEPAGADDAARSLAKGEIIPSVDPQTIADGLRSSLGERPFREIQRYTDGILTVSEEAIIAAMRQLWEILKIVVEPSAAVAYAAILERKLPIEGRKVGIVLTGGNLDLDKLPWA
ncbi:MAG: pyridoxal-phosphate dependent enzyme [Blastomonas sp.]